MFKKSKSAEPAEPFRAPRLVDVDAAYERLIETRTRLLDEQTALTTEKRALVSETTDAPAPSRRVRTVVAELLGDQVDDGPAHKRRRLAEVTSRIGDIGDALEELRKRIDEASGPASRKACDIVRDEYAARVSRLCETLLAVDEAQREYEALIEDLEAEDIRWLSLGVFKPTFLGSSREPDRRIARFLSEAKTAGYWSEASR